MIMNVVITDCRRSAFHPKEKNDCTVRATAACIGMPYEDVHKRMADLGRKNGKGFIFRYSNGLEDFHLDTVPHLSCKRLSSILPELQKGRFIVKISRHVFAVIDGIIVDLKKPNPNCIVKMVYKKIEA